MVVMKRIAVSFLAIAFLVVSDPMLLKSSMKHAVPIQFSFDLVVNLFGLFK